jgi:nitroreductase
VELDQAIGLRRMCRHFQDRPVPPGVVDHLIDLARRAPSAGNTQGWAFLVLEGAEQTGRFWSADADPAWLASPDHPGLLNAPVLIIPLCSRQAYLDRYARPDKASSGLVGESDWPAPYWLIDTAFATMLLLLGAVDAGLGALFFRLHAGAGGVRAAFGVPDEWEPIGAVALGWPDMADRPRRAGPNPHERTRGAVVHRAGW